MKKKFLIILLSLLFVFSLTGCISSAALDKETQAGSSDSPAEADSSKGIPTASTEAGNSSSERNSTKNNLSENNSMKSNSMEVSSMDASAAEAAPQEISSLQDWLDSENKEQNVTDANAQLKPAGLAVDFYAEDGNILVLEYTFVEQQDMGNDMDEIHKTFEKSIAPVYSDSVTSLFGDFESEYGIILDDVKLVFCNADGTELYSVYCNR